MEASRSIWHVGCLALLLVSLTACEHYKIDYEPPDTGVFETSQFAASMSTHGAPFPGFGWWTDLGDPVLDALIDEALKENSDLRIASLRLLEAREVQRAAVLNSRPLGRLTGDARADLIKSSGGLAGDDAASIQGVTFSITNPLSWELDVYGRLQSQAQIASSEVDIAEATLSEVQQSIVSDLVTAYVEYHGAEQRIQASSRNIEVQRIVLRNITTLYEHGATTQLDVERANFRSEQIHRELGELIFQRESALNRLAIITGTPPARFARDRLDVGHQLQLPVSLYVSSPAQLIRQRPDVRIAERQLKIAAENLNIEMSNFFPRFALLGEAGVNSQFGSGAPQSVSFQYFFGPTLEWGILDHQRNQIRVQQQKYVFERAVVEFEQTVLDALEEAESALLSYHAEVDRMKSLERAVSAAGVALDLSQERVNAGAGTLSDLYEAHEELIEFEEALAQSETILLSRLVAVYRSFGGGVNLNSAG